MSGTSSADGGQTFFAGGPVMPELLINIFDAAASGWWFLHDIAVRASPDAWLQSLFAFTGLVFAAWAFFAQQGIANKLQRNEVYQRLELASNDLFSFEADHAEALEKFRDEERRKWKFTPVEHAALDEWSSFEDGQLSAKATGDAQATLAQLEADWRKVRKYYEKALNLFEMAARLRAARILDAEVFGSWTIWYYDTLCEWGFRQHWSTIKQNYTSELRNVFDFYVQRYDPEVPDAHRKRDFFMHVAKLYRCEVIARWLDNIAVQDARVDSAQRPRYKRWLRTGLMPR